MPKIFSFLLGSGSGGSGDFFKTYVTPFGSSVIATVTDDTITFSSSDNSIRITGDAFSKTLDFSSAFLGVTLSSGAVLYAGVTGAISGDVDNFSWDSSFKSLSIGTTTPVTSLDGSPIASAITTVSNSYPRISSSMLGYGASSIFPFQVFGYANGTYASPTSPIENDILGAINFAGWSSTHFITGAQIAAIGQSGISGSNMPTWLYLATNGFSGLLPSVILDQTQSAYFFGELYPTLTPANSVPYIDINSKLNHSADLSWNNALSRLTTSSLKVSSLNASELVSTTAASVLQSESFTANGQLIIGKSTGGFSKSTLTAGSNIVVTNGSGSVTVATSLTPTFTSITVGTITTSLTPDRVVITGSTGDLTTTGFLKWISASNQLNITGTGASISLGFVKIDIQDSFTYCTGANVGIYRANGTTKEFKFYNGTSAASTNKRWAIFVDNTAESGANAGSNFRYNAYSDTGVFIDSPMQIERAASGGITFTRNVQFNGFGVWLVYARTPQIYGSTVAGGDLLINSTTNATKGSVFISASSNFDESLGFVKLGSTATPSKELDVAGEIISSSNIYSGSETGSSKVMIRMNRYFGTEAATSGHANKISLFNSGGSNDPVYGFGISSGSLDLVSSSSFKFWSGTTNVVVIGATSFTMAAGGMSVTQTRATTGNAHVFVDNNSATSGSATNLRAATTPANTGSSSATYASIVASPTMTSIGASITGQVVSYFSTVDLPPNTFTVTNVKCASFNLQRTITGGTVTNMIGLEIGQGTNSAGTVTTAYGIKVAAITSGATNWSVAVAGGDCHFGGNTRLGGTTAPTVACDITGALAVSTTSTFSGDVTMTTKVTTYNNVATVAAGVPSLVATSNLTAQGAAIAATTIYAVPASGAGMYRVSWSATITRAATTSCVLGGTNGFQLKYTDLNDSVVKTSNPTTVTSSAVNATGTAISGTFNAYCKASTNLQYLFDYTSVGGTTMQYDLSIRVEALG